MQMQLAKRGLATRCGVPPQGLKPGAPWSRPYPACRKHGLDRFPFNTGAKASSAGSANQPADDPLKDPTLIFPDKPWIWEKAEPKSSLKELQPPQDGNAKAWILNLIEAIHWLSFPLGFYVVYYVFINSAKIAPFVGGDQARVFLLVLGLLSQVFGGGITGNMMHEYEGWQVTPFRNILGAEGDTASPKEVLSQVQVSKYNNAWLRTVAYKLLFGFQTLGLGLFTAAAFGITAWTVALVAGSVLVALVGPHIPRTNFRVNGQPIVPLSWSLLIVFAINVIFNLLGYRVVFGDAVAAAWPPTLLPWLSFIPTAIVKWIPLIAPLLVAAGGAIEGGIAESNFNQWWHFIAFAILVAGLGVHGALYWHLVNA